MPLNKFNFTQYSKIFISLIICLNSIEAKISREQKILKIQIPNASIIHDKSIALNLITNIQKDKNFNQSIVSPGLLFNHRFNLEKKRTNYFDSLNYYINYSSFRKEFSIDDYTDLSIKAINTILDYKNSYKFFSETDHTLFLGIENQSSLQGVYQTTKDYSASINPDDLSDALKDVLISSWKKEQSFNLNYHISYSPSIGIGRIEDRSRIIKALIIEKLLLKRKVIKFSFSNLTINKISSLIGSFSNNDLRKESLMEEFRSKLNEIVKSDAAADRDMLRYISPLDLKKVLLILYGGVNKGASFSIKSPGNLSASFKSSKVSYPYDVFNKYLPYEEDKYKTNFRQDLMLHALFNKNLKDLLFFNISISRVLLSTDFSPDFKDSENNIKWINVLDTRWNFDTYFIPHPNFQVQLGTKNLRSYIFIPNNPPKEIYTSFNIFIEDNLKINTILKYNFKLNNDPYEYLYENVESQFSEYRKLVFALILCYNF